MTAIEAASISAVMIHAKDSFTVVRDTLFAVIMIILNGMVGSALLLGAWRHREQSYNLQGANTYLSVIIPLAVMSLIMPNYTQTTPGPTLSSGQQIFLGLMCVGLYGAFLAVQTVRHRGYFVLEGEGDDDHHGAAPFSAAVTATRRHGPYPRLAPRGFGPVNSFAPDIRRGPRAFPARARAACTRGSRWECGPWRPDRR